MAHSEPQVGPPTEPVPIHPERTPTTRLVRNRPRPLHLADDVDAAPSIRQGDIMPDTDVDTADAARGTMTQTAPGLAALLPLKLSGRHYADNLGRLDVLLSSLLHFGEPGLLDAFLVVTPADEVRVVRRHLDGWPEFDMTVVVEEEHFPAFRRYRRPWQVRPWQRQQIIKLAAPDADHGALRPHPRPRCPGGAEGEPRPSAARAVAPSSNRSRGPRTRPGGGRPPMCSTSRRTCPVRASGSRLRCCPGRSSRASIDGSRRCPAGHGWTHC